MRTRSMAWYFRHVMTAAICVVLITAPAIARDARTIPGSRVTIDVPAIYKSTERFAGFETADQSASIVVLDVPVLGYDQIVENLTPQTLASRGFSKIERATIDGRAEPYAYFVGEQVSPAGPLLKHILLLKRTEHAALITISVLKATANQPGVTDTEIKRILVSAAITDTMAVQASPFAFSYLGPLKEATITGAARVYTRDGAAAPATPQPGRTLFLVAPSLQKARIDDIASVAARVAVQVADTKDIVIGKTGPITIAGLEGVELEATGKAGVSGAPVSFYQVFLKHPAGGYIRMIGQVETAEATALLPEFQKIARSFSLAK